MKHKLTFLTAVICSLLTFSKTYSQVSPPQVLVWGVSPNQDSLWSADPFNSFDIVNRVSPTLSGFTITGMTGLAFDPCEYQTYVVLNAFGVFGRLLATIDLTTGVCVQIANLGDKISSITFRKDGQLFGVTGDGASIGETLFLIDKSTGIKTLAVALGAGDDGEIICYNPADDFIYHWSGNGLFAFEKILPNSPYTVASIPFTGTPNGETFGALHWDTDTFLISSTSGSLNYNLTDGTWFPTIVTLNNNLRGMVMPPVFALENDTVCSKHDAVQVYAAAVADYKIIYNWGDGNSDTIQSGSGSHIYTSNGDFQINVLLDYGACPPDTFWTTNVHVNSLPTVSITGLNGICPGGSVVLTGTSGGNSQWYQNGNILANDTNNTVTVSTPGIYNMIKTNTNGCSDSASVGKTVVNVNNPSVGLGNDTTRCGGIITLDAGNPGLTFLWNDNSTNQTLSVTDSGTYSVVVTDSNACTATDSIDVIIHAIPGVTLVLADDSTCSGTTPIVLTGGLPLAGNYSGNNVSGGNFTPSTLGINTISYEFTDNNGCTDTATADITVFVCLGIHDLSSGSVVLYPNPSHDFVTLKADGLNGDILVEIFDLSGGKIEHWKGKSISSVYQHTFDLTQYAAGTYVVDVKTQIGSVRYTLIIK